MTDFSLAAIIQQVIDETDLASPDEIAGKVAEMVPSKHLRAALAEALPHVVRIELTRSRGRVAPVRRIANRSSKVAAIRNEIESWRNRLRDRISTGSSRHDWKLLADCTAADFRQAAGQRRAFADGALRAANEFDSFADALDRHKVSRFADLPESVQAELLGGTEKAA